MKKSGKQVCFLTLKIGRTVKTTNPFRQKGINIIFVICIHLHIKAVKIHTDNSIPTSVEISPCMDKD